jgi:FKBP-type peptidyl-prolyl cis-trans isomerase (trigger factor)
MHVEVFPEVEIDSKYKKIKLPKTKVEISDSEIEQALIEIQRKFTKFVEAEETYTSKM